MCSVMLTSLNCTLFKTTRRFVHFAKEVFIGNKIHEAQNVSEIPPSNTTQLKTLKKSKSFGASKGAVMLYCTISLLNSKQKFRRLIQTS